MKKLILPLVVLLLTGCNLTPPSNFKADLTRQIGGGQSCANTGVNLITSGGGNEVITVKFAKTFKILDLRPEGERKTAAAVYWSTISQDDPQRQALLTVPEKLKVGSLDNYNNKEMCVMFYPAAFTSEENELEQFAELADKTCCGIISVAIK